MQTKTYGILASVHSHVSGNNFRTLVATLSSSDGIICGGSLPTSLIMRAEEWLAIFSLLFRGLNALRIELNAMLPLGRLLHPPNRLRRKGRGFGRAVG